MEDLLDQIPCGVVTFNDRGLIGYANPTLCELLTCDADDLAGAKFESILTVSSKIFHQTHLYPLLKMSGRADEIFLSFTASSGMEVPVLANAVRKEIGEDFVNVCACIPVHERQRYEEELIAARHRAEEALQNNQELQQAKAELERNARDLDRHLTRLEQNHRELTRLSRILSHDLREPVRKATVFADFLQHQTDADLPPSVVESAEKIKASFDRLDGLLSRLEQYLSIGVGPERFEEIDLDAVVSQAAHAVATASGRGDLQVDRHALPTVEGVRDQLVQLFVQLLENSVKFSKPGAPPEVVIGGTVVRQNIFREASGRYRYADFAQVTIADKGIGFEDEYSDYVFGVLKKLDPETEGLGLGLSICRKIVEHHAGSISIHSEPGEGTQVRVRLPVQRVE